MRTLAVVAVVAVAVLAISIHAQMDDDDDVKECAIVDAKCLDEGDDCEGDFWYNYSFCTEGKNESKCCAEPLYCIRGKCQEDSRDENCTKDYQCYPAFYGTHLISCIKNKCVVQGAFNDSCIKDEHCVGEQKCDKNGKCAGRALNANCTLREECGANMTCRDDNTCVKAKAVGDKCDSTDECDVYSICVDGKCIERYSVKEDGKCIDYFACGKGLVCKEGICKKGIKRQMIECTNTSDCKSYSNTSECTECDAVTGKMYCSHPDDVEPDCISELIAAFKCYRKNGCYPTPSSSLDTCAQLECTAETNAIFSCQTMCEDFKYQVGKRCLSSLMLRYCPLLPTWLRIVIAFSILVVIIVVVFVIYAIYNCCRKDGYQEVPSDDPETTPEVVTSGAKTSGN